MYYRYGNFFNEHHGADSHYYMDITAPPPPGVKLDPDRMVDLIHLAIPGLRIRHSPERDGRMDVNGFFTTVGPSPEDGSMLYVITLYDFRCVDPSCRIGGHTGEVECEDPECPALPTESSTQRWLAEPKGNYGMQELFTAEELQALTRYLGPTAPLPLAAGKHTHRRAVELEPVAPFTDHQVGRIKALLGTHPTYYLTEDVGRAHQVLRQVGFDPDDKDQRWQSFYELGRPYRSPSDQHVLPAYEAPPPPPAAVAPPPSNRQPRPRSNLLWTPGTA